MTVHSCHLDERIPVAMTFVTCRSHIASRRIGIMTSAAARGQGSIGSVVITSDRAASMHSGSKGEAHII